MVNLLENSIVVKGSMEKDDKVTHSVYFRFPDTTMSCHFTIDS